MIKLLIFSLVWRAIRLIAGTAVVIGAVALLEPSVNSHAGAAARAAAGLTQLRGAAHQLEQLLKGTIETTFKP